MDKFWGMTNLAYELDISTTKLKSIIDRFNLLDGKHIYKDYSDSHQRYVFDEIAVQIIRDYLEYNFTPKYPNENNLSEYVGETLNNNESVVNMTNEFQANINSDNVSENENPEIVEFPIDDISSTRVNENNSVFSNQPRENTENNIENTTKENNEFIQKNQILDFVSEVLDNQLILTDELWRKLVTICDKIIKAEEEFEKLKTNNTNLQKELNNLVETRDNYIQNEVFLFKLSFLSDYNYDFDIEELKKTKNDRNYQEEMRIYWFDSYTELKSKFEDLQKEKIAIKEELEKIKTDNIELEKYRNHWAEEYFKKDEECEILKQGKEKRKVNKNTVENIVLIWLLLLTFITVGLIAK